MRSAKYSTQISPFVAEDDMEEVAAEVRQHLLDPLREMVELGHRIGVVVVVDPSESHENRVSSAKFGQELAATRDKPVVDRRQDPRADQRFAEWSGWRRWRHLDMDAEPGKNANCRFVVAVVGVR